MIDEKKRRTDELKVKEQELIVKQGQIQAELSKLERAKVQIDKDKGDVAASLKASLAVLDDLIKMGCHENEDINVCTERVNKLPSGDGTFIRPLRTGTVTSEFGWRNVNIPGATNNHIGIDIGAPFGTPVYATAPGRVIYPGWYGSAGQTIHVIHTINGVNYTSAYQHLNSINVSHNQIVQHGQIIGYVGSAGASSGPHLHFGLFYGWYGYDQSFWGGAYYANAMNPRTKLYFPPLYVYWRE